MGGLIRGGIGRLGRGRGMRGFGWGMRIRGGGSGCDVAFVFCEVRWRVCFLGLVEVG